MVLIHNVVIVLFFYLLCGVAWGSWANTEKLIKQPRWSFELYYWDFTWGLMLTAAVAALTLGSLGEGTTFIDDLSRPDWASIGWAVLGGALWNVSNILLTAAITIAGMSVAFPIGGGIGWTGGIVFNFLLLVMAGKEYPGPVGLLWSGIGAIALGILLCALAFRRLATSRHQTPTRGLVLSVASGIGLVFYYGLVVKSLSPQYVAGGTGTLTPYTGVFFFAVGVVLTTLVVNGIMMRHPLAGEPSSWRTYASGSAATHLKGMAGGLIWMAGMVLGFMAIGRTAPAVSYALSNTAPIVAMAWGVFVWKEFKDAPKGTGRLITLMFVTFIAGLVMIALSN